MEKTGKEAKPRIVILGGGLAGLGCAYKLALAGFPATLFEAEDRVGGFSTSFRFKDCIFDYGPHAFHAPDKELLQFYLDYMGDDVLIMKKHVEIKFRNKFYDYPIKPVNLLKNLSVFVLLRCGLSFLWQSITKYFVKSEKQGSLEELFVSLYGKALYRLFFEKYTTKVWGFHPRNLSLTFLKFRLPPFTLLQMAMKSLKEIINREDKGELSKDSFPVLQYYPRYGAGTFTDKLAKDTTDHGGIIELNSPVQKIQVQDGKVTGVTVMRDGVLKTIPCDICVTTIPLTHFINYLDPEPPENIRHSVEQLHFRAIIIFCIVVKRDSVIHCDALYFHDRIFHRMGQMNSYSDDTTPPGKSAVTVEVACFKGDPLWDMDEKELFQWVLKDLLEEGFDIEDDVEDYFVLRSEYGYPAPTLGYEEHLVRVFAYLSEIPNLYSGGRQGLFTYIQMFHALQMGFMIANEISSGKPKEKFSMEGDSKQIAGKDPYFI